MVIMFFAVIVGLAITDLRSPDRQLVRRFDELAFDSGPNSPVGVKSVWKWDMPITIGVRGGTELDHALVRFSTYFLRRLTGLDMTVTDGNKWAANVDLYFAEKSKWPDIARRHDGKELRDRDFMNFICMVNPEGSVGRLHGGYILIPTGLSPNDTFGCILHEMVHLLGLMGHSRSTSPSVLARADVEGDFTLRDMILIRALYDSRIKPGMSREKALIIVRKVFSGLRAAVDESGEDALTHPRHKPLPSEEIKKTLALIQKAVGQKNRGDLLKELKKH